jgi:hypothetical protein
MSAPEYDGQPMTKREVLIAREAYTRRSRETYSVEEWERSIRGLVEGEAAMTYPLPKVTRPRVVMDGDGAGWRFIPISEGVENGRFERSDTRDLWRPVSQVPAWPDIIAILADLLANPTEEVDA